MMVVVEAFTQVISYMTRAGGSGDPEIVKPLDLIRAKAQPAADMLKSAAEQQSKTDFPSGVPLPASRPAAANNSDPNAALLPKCKNGEEAADAYDRATEALNKYIATTSAAAETEGKSSAAIEEAKAEAQLLNTARLAGISIPDKVRNQIQDLAQDAGLAAEALANAKVASDIQFGAKSAFLTPQDLAIAQQLNGIYGNDIPEALRSAEAAGVRYNATIKELAQLGEQVNSSFF